MKTGIQAPLLAAPLLLFLAADASALTSDHLQCFKIKDAGTKAKYSATLTPTDTAFAAAAGCQIKTPAKLLCVDTTKTAVVPAPPGAPDGEPAQTYLCYKTKCPASAATASYDDQFGNHPVTVKKTGLVCAPVDPAVTTTTTSTLPPGGCSIAGDCPGSDTECSQRSCTLGSCGFTLTPAGTPLAMQTSGNCQTAVCDGTGLTTTIPNNMDTPEDGNDCTDNVCNAGAPSNPPKAMNSSCSSNGGTVCNSSGSCVECNSPTQCSGMDTECQQRSCSAGSCGFTFAPAGMPLVSGQTPGDCQELQCNGSGGSGSAANNSDIPNDNADCTMDSCNAGAPQFLPVPTNTICDDGGGSVCNSGGVCVQCNHPSQCPGSDTECQSRSCVSNSCGLNFTAAGTPTSFQNSGDCQEFQCNGSGGTISADDNADVPNDNFQCSIDSCVGGMPTYSNEPDGTPCNQNGGTNCQSGACIP